jgi:hypothetical protein
MTPAVKVSMATCGLLVLATTVATAFFGFMMWALALNGFMGQERAVNASMVAYIVLAVTSAIVTVSLSVATVYFLAGRRGWNAAGSAVLSVVVFAITSGVLHTLCVVISALVASALRTTR